MRSGINGPSVNFDAIFGCYYLPNSEKIHNMLITNVRKGPVLYMLIRACVFRVYVQYYNDNSYCTISIGSNAFV